MLRWAKRYCLAIALFAIGAIVVAVGGVLGHKAAHELSSPFALEMAKAVLGLGTGLILGGALKVLLDQYQAAQREQQETHELRERLLADIRGVYDQVERGRLTIRAQESASAYHEQMQLLIGCQAVLLKFKRSIELRWASLKYVDPQGQCLRTMIGYLRALQDEYTQNYQQVRDCQGYDEEVMRRRLSELAIAGTSPCDSGTDAITHHTRDLLNDVQRLPVLHDLTACGWQYSDAFAQPLHALAARLLMTTGTCRELDTEFDKHVDETARRITCTLRGEP